MKNNFKIRSILYTLLVSFYIFLLFFQEYIIDLAVSLFAIFSVLFSLNASNINSRVLSSLFIIGGLWVAYYNGLSLEACFMAFKGMVYLVVLFAVVPVLSIPIRSGHYDQAMEIILSHKIKKIASLHMVTMLLAYLFGSFMSLGAVPVMISSLRTVMEKFRISDKVRFNSVVTITGYLLPTLWTPVSGVVGLVTSSYRINWFNLFLFVLPMSIIGLFVNNLIFYLMEVRPNREDSNYPGTTTASASLDLAYRKLMEMVIAITLLVFFILSVENIIGASFVDVVIIVTIPFALFWNIAIGKAREFFDSLSRDFVERLPRMSDQMTIFLSAGFFVQIIQFAGLDRIANMLVFAVIKVTGIFWFLILLPVFTLVTSFIGIHPLVSIALFSESLNPEILGIVPEQLAITLIVGAILTYMLGPFSGTLGLVQSMTGVSTFRLLRWNIPYAIGFFSLFFCSLVLMRIF